MAGEGAYVRYEMWLRRLESQRAGLVGLSGSFFGVRRSIVRDWNASIPSDFACAMHAVRAGMRAVADPRVVGVYRDIKDPSKEFARKVRTAIRGMTAVAVMQRGVEPIQVRGLRLPGLGPQDHAVARALVHGLAAGGVRVPGAGACVVRSGASAPVAGVRNGLGRCARARSQTNCAGEAGLLLRAGEPGVGSRIARVSQRAAHRAVGAFCPKGGDGDVIATDVSQQAPPDWDDYVLAHAGANAFQLASAVLIGNRAFGLPAHFVTARDEWRTVARRAAAG